jgi:alpha-amylase
MRAMHEIRSLPRSPRLPLVAVGALALTLAACGAPAATPEPQQPQVPPGSGAPALTGAAPSAAPGSFADNPIVYFVITDRFLDGNPANNNSYGRRGDGTQEIGTFHGGDLAGLTRKLEDGYFRDLGVNAIWITAPYEQIRGWIVGGNKEFQHYAYHGYYALDYTVLDQNMGTADELRRFIDTAHEQDIRVVFDIVINHPGYADLQSLDEFGVKVLWKGWEQATLSDYHSFIDYNNFAFKDWWGPGWVRAGLPGYPEAPSMDDLEMQLAFLPDFRTESTEAVALPVFLTRKSDTRAKTIPGFTVRQYLVKWLTDWVREYGVDGFRCDTAKHVELASWAALKAAGVEALAAWKQANPGKAVDGAPFWMTGEVFPHGVDRDDYFDRGGFDNLINFDFQHRLAEILGAPEAKAETDRWSRIDALYAEYAAKISADPTFNVLTYISSHDTRLFDRKKLFPAGTALLLAPGGVQIFYGDESARPPGPTPNSDPQQNTRSDMNWQAMDQELLAHWRALGQFRRRHVALAKGAHRKLGDAPYTFARVHREDRVVAAVGVKGQVALPVGDVFPEGARVQDAVTGAQAVVAGGKVIITAGPHGVVLLEALRAAR